MRRPGRPKTEPTRLRSMRLPVRLWDLFDTAADSFNRSGNGQFRKLIEDFLVSEGLLDENDRKRPTKPKNKQGE